MIKIKYENEIIYDNTTVDARHATSIHFENLGEQDATINGEIPLTAAKIRQFNNQALEEIDDNFTIMFSGTGTKKVLIVRTFTREA